MRLSTILFLFFILFVTQIMTTEYTAIVKAKSGNNAAPSYIEHEPIKIDANEDFIQLEFPGKGTPTDPYVIEGYIITGNELDLICINNTNVYFRIQNNWLEGTGEYGVNSGIKIVNVENGNICYNTIQGANQAGISLSFSSYNFIINNTIYDNDICGISVGSGCNNTNIQGNKIFDNGNIGIEIITLCSGNELCFSNKILGNKIYNHSGAGLLINSSSGHIFSGNNISFNYWGVHCFSNSNNNTFFNNSISFNTNEGINFYGDSDENFVFWNNFMENNLDKESQVIDNGIKNSLYLNYWNEWTSPDKNEDGFVDDPYLILGKAKNEDPFPVIKPNLVIAAIFPPEWPYLYTMTSQTEELSSVTKTTPLNVSSIQGLCFIIVIVLFKCKKVKKSKK